jgi:hypothetical protein
MGGRFITVVATAEDDRCDFIIYNPNTLTGTLAQAIRAETANFGIIMTPADANAEAQRHYNDMFTACQTGDAEGLTYQKISYEGPLESGGPASVTLSTDEAVLQQSTIESNGSAVHTIYDPLHAFAWDSQITQTDADGNVLVHLEVSDSGGASGFVGATSIDLGSIGGILGSQIGHILGGNSLVGRVAAGTLAEAIGREIGQGLQLGTISTSLTNFIFGTSPLDRAFHQGESALEAGYTGGLAGAAIGQISSLLMAELADELNLDGFGAGLFQSVGTTITSQLVTNVFNMAVLGTHPITGAAFTLFDGLSPGALFNNMSGAIGGFLGSTLAAQIVMPHTPAEALGASIGSSIGAYLGTFIPIPVLGTVFIKLLARRPRRTSNRCSHARVKARTSTRRQGRTGRKNDGRRTRAVVASRCGQNFLCRKYLFKLHARGYLLA